MFDEKLFLKVFPNYCRLWQQWNIQYHLTPEWRMIRKHRILNRMHKLTVEYDKWFQKMMYPKMEVDKDGLQTRPKI